MVEPTLRDLLIETSEGVRAGDLGSRAVIVARRRVQRRKLAAGAVAVAGSVLAVAGPLGGSRLFDPSSAPDRPTAPAARPDVAASSDHDLVGGWEIQGEPQWVPLRNHYYAATFYAVNRTSGDLSPVRGLALWVSYANAPGKFDAVCEVEEFTGKRPINRQELFFETTRREQPVAPGERVFMACFQTAGSVPDRGDLPRNGDLRVDAESVRFFTW
jgi:hypothetical protein